MLKVEDIKTYSKKLIILYIEESDEIRKSNRLFFQDFFKVIRTAKTAQEALIIFDNSKNINSIDLIITDIDITKTQGLDLIRKFRSRNTDIPILILSTLKDSKYFIESIELSVDAYLFKPLNKDEFLEALNKTITKLKVADETKEKKLFFEQYKNITDESSLISVIDKNKTITYVNKAFCEISGYKEEELLGRSYSSILDYMQPEEINKDIWDTLEIKKKIWTGILKFTSKRGIPSYLKTTITPVFDEKGDILKYIALRDNITAIINPKKQLEDAVINAKKAVVIYIKLDEFNILEEFYSNKIVETIQNKITLYLEKHIPKDFNFDKVYQLGQGEYALTNEKDLCMGNTDEFLKKLKEYQETVTNGSINIKNVDYDMSVLISVAYEKKEILQSAKLGIRKLLKTKQDFIVSNNFAHLEQEKAKANMQTISIIKKAINSSKIISFFQPIINNKTQDIEKYESLVRLVDDNDNILTPNLFLDVAKKGKYYSQITALVLTNSFTALAKTNKEISINLSAIDIEQKSTRDKIFSLLKEHKKDSSRIIIELLEDENVKDFKTIRSFITNVKRLGVKIAIDDFGAGYSNFERLLDYQPDILKIDGCLIRNIHNNSYSLSVVKTIVAFAKEQHIQTVAEYVENKEIFFYLA